MKAAADLMKQGVQWLHTVSRSQDMQHHRTGGNTGLMVLYQKELEDQFSSKRFLIVLGLIFVTGLASVYSAASGIHAAISKQGTDFVFLKLFTSSGASLPSFLTFIAFLGPIVGLALGFDAINGERSRGTLSRLMAQPIYRDAVINGKYLAGLTVIAIMVFSIGLIVGGLGIILIGVPPTGEELARILLFLVFTVVYMALWLAVSMLFSILFRHAATSALSVIAVWLFFVIFMQLVAGIVANALFPVSDSANYAVMIHNVNTQQALSRLSPSVLYSEAVGTILDPSARTLSSFLLTDQIQGAVAGALPFGQSVLLVWPHLIGLLALTVLCFALSYISFMRQEVRAG